MEQAKALKVLKPEAQGKRSVALGWESQNIRPCKGRR